MSKLIVIDSPSSWHVNQLVEAASSLFEVDVISFGELADAINLPATQVDLPSGIIVRGMPRGSLEQIIFRMDRLDRWHRSGVPMINPPKALELAIDKYLSLARLADAGIPVPASFACQRATLAWEAFEILGRDVVVKPLFGGEGRSMIRVREPDLADRTFQLLEQTGSVIYLQKFIDHPGFDYRLLMVGDGCFAIKRANDRDWRTNVSRGATVSRVDPHPDHLQLAYEVAQVSGCQVAGIDIIEDSEGRPHVLEVNAVPGWKAVQQVHQSTIAQEIVRLFQM